MNATNVANCFPLLVTIGGDVVGKTVKSLTAGVVQLILLALVVCFGLFFIGTVSKSIGTACDIIGTSLVMLGEFARVMDFVVALIATLFFAVV